MRQVEITVSPTGETKVEVIGGQGASCSDLTRAIEESIGKTTGDVKKPEYHQQSTQGNQQQAGW